MGHFFDALRLWEVNLEEKMSISYTSHCSQCCHREQFLQGIDLLRNLDIKMARRQCLLWARILIWAQTRARLDPTLHSSIMSTTASAMIQQAPC